MKIEPRDQSISPFQLHPGNYREVNQATPSPQPLSPQMFNQASPSPLPYHPPQNILHNHLQGGMRLQPPNNFNQLHQQNYTPSIHPGPSFVPATSAIWTGNVKVTDTVGNKTYTNMQNSNIFNQPMPILQNNQNIVQNVPNTNENPMTISSSLFDFDALQNLSGDLQQFSLSDLGNLDSFSRTGEKSNNFNK